MVCTVTWVYIVQHYVSEMTNIQTVTHESDGAKQRGETEQSINY